MIVPSILVSADSSGTYEGAGTSSIVTAKNLREVGFEPTPLRTAVLTEADLEGRFQRICFPP